MTPETFNHEMQLRLGPGYRLRRSADSPRWCFEQKVARPVDFPSTTDKQIRMREGYSLFLDTPDSDSTTCPTCHLRLSLPVFERREFYCEYCQSRGQRTRIVDGYFPLVDKTLTYLERLHPRRGLAWHKENMARDAALEQSRRRDSRNLAHDLAADYWNRVANIPVFGRTGVGTPHSYGGALSV